MDKVLVQLLEKLRKAYGERLVSVVLYGSAVTGERHAGFSDYNILCVLTEIMPRELGAGTDLFRWWREQGCPSPLLMTEHEVATSTDCFAIEFRDIQAHHQILFGKDVVSGLAMEDGFYRAQVEHDLRAKLLRLRQKASGMLNDANLLRRLLLDSISTFSVLFRHALKLHGVDAPARKREVLRLAQERFGIDPAPFEKLLDVREGRIKAREIEPVELLAAYLGGIYKVIDAVDRLDK
jgi:hypothetical protein